MPNQITGYPSNHPSTQQRAKLHSKYQSKKNPQKTNYCPHGGERSDGKASVGGGYVVVYIILTISYV